MRLYFALIALLWLVLGLSSAVLSWDGAYHLFRVLQYQAPDLEFRRWSNLPLHAVALGVSGLTSDVHLAALAFGLCAAVYPLLCLWLCRRITRDTDERLFVWAALGISLGALPGQFFLVSESVVVSELAWIPMTFVAAGAPARHAPLIAAVALFAFFLHPASGPLLVLCGCVAGAVAFRREDLRRTLVPWAVALAGLGFTRMIFLRLGFDHQIVEWRLYHDDYVAALRGPVLLGLTLGLATAGTLLLGRPRVAAVFLAGAAASLIFWSLDPVRWHGAVAYRTYVPIVTAAFATPLVLDAMGRPGRLDVVRLRMAQAAAALALVVVSAQAVGWNRLLGRYQEALASGPPCIEQQQLPFAAKTPVAHWGGVPLALLLQGRRPTHLVLGEGSCSEPGFAEKVRIAPWEVDSRRGGWFDLSTAGL